MGCGDGVGERGQRDGERLEQRVQGGELRALHVPVGVLQGQLQVVQCVQAQLEDLADTVAVLELESGNVQRHLLDDARFDLRDAGNLRGAIANRRNIRSGAGMFGYTHLYGGYAGGQAEFVRVPCANTGPLKLPDSGLSDEQVLFLSDILPTGWQAAVQCEIQPTDTVAIWGAGRTGKRQHEPRRDELPHRHHPPHLSRRERLEVAVLVQHPSGETRRGPGVVIGHGLRHQQHLAAVAAEIERSPIELRAREAEVFAHQVEPPQREARAGEQQIRIIEQRDKLLASTQAANSS